MKFKFMLIGLALVLMLCISPVAAVSADDFEIVHDDSQYYDTYTYRNVNDPDEKYIKITTDSTRYSFVTFKPVGIKGAPVMIVNTTNKNADIYLPKSVDEWVIKSYSTSEYMPYLDSKYLKNLGVVNLKEISGKYISKEFKLVQGKFIFCQNSKDRILIYTIPDVPTSDAFRLDIVSVHSGASYNYHNINNRTEMYTQIWVSKYLSSNSLITIRPANIPDAPTMVVKGGVRGWVYLPQSVDEWEFKYYCSTEPLSQPDPMYLKNLGIINLNEHFGKTIKHKIDHENVLDLGYADRLYIESTHWPYPTWHIPEV